MRQPARAAAGAEWYFIPGTALVGDAAAAAATGAMKASVAIPAMMSLPVLCMSLPLG
jgi:hypothetical protein